MATAPVKSQPLHNFSLPYLKWGHKNQVNNGHRFRRPAESARDSPPPPPPHLPPPSGHFSVSPSRPESDGGSKSKSETRNRFSFSSCSTQKQEWVAVERVPDEADEEREKISDGADVEESPAKPWNLRPRKLVSKAVAEIGSVLKNGGVQDMPMAEAAVTAIAPPQAESQPKSMRLRGFAEGHGTERKEKRKFWIALSREEIEEDVYAMTGLRPARRPKKRPKNVQKQLDVRN